MQRLIDTVRRWARHLKQELLVIHFALRDSETPRCAKALAVLVLCYALSPIDLIPDFIPVLGLLDDLLIVPLGIALTVRLIPPTVIERCRASAAAAPQCLPRSRVGLMLIVALWCAMAAAIIWWLARGNNV